VTDRLSFDDALDAALDALRAGMPLEQVLAQQPEHAAALRPLLRTALAARVGRRAGVPEPRDLAGNFVVVRAALERARIADGGSAPRRERPVAPWWQRRLSFASLSVPAGVVAAIAIAGAGGAAAASVAATSARLPQRLAGAAAPGWVHDLVPGGESEHVSAPPPGTSSSATAVASAGEQAAQAPGGGRGELASVSGIVADVRGNTFMLVSADGEWKVQRDADTATRGEVVDGAAATVDGEISGGKQLHARRIDVTRTPIAADDTRPGQGGGDDGTPEAKPDDKKGTPSQSEGDATTEPSDDRTPAASDDLSSPRQADDHTPPGQSKDHTPSGQSGDNGHGGESGDGDSGDKKPQ
jgi:hypothetical protein